MAAVCAAGPEPIMTTLLCTILDADVELTRTGVARGWDRTEAVGEDFWCRDDAAAAVNPREDRRVEKGKRRKIEENSLTVGIVKRGKVGEEEEEEDRERRENGYFNFNGRKTSLRLAAKKRGRRWGLLQTRTRDYHITNRFFEVLSTSKREILRNQLCRDPVTCALLSKRPRARIHDIMNAE